MSNDIFKIPYILQNKYIENHGKELNVLMETIFKKEIQRELKQIKNLINRPSVTMGRYVNTKDAAIFLGVDTSFLTKRKGKIFKLGQHFYKPAGQSIVRWNIEALHKWMTAEYDDTLIDDELAALLERS